MSTRTGVTSFQSTDRFLAHSVVIIIMLFIIGIVTLRLYFCILLILYVMYVVCLLGE